LVPAPSTVCHKAGSTFSIWRQVRTVLVSGVFLWNQSHNRQPLVKRIWVSYEFLALKVEIKQRFKVPSLTRCHTSNNFSCCFRAFPISLETQDARIFWWILVSSVPSTIGSKPSCMLHIGLSLNTAKVFTQEIAGVSNNGKQSENKLLIK